MTSSSSSRWSRGWNPPKVTGETGLHIYVAADGTVTGYFKGRINGVSKPIKLEGDTLTEWKQKVRALRSGSADVTLQITDRRLRVDDYIPIYIEKLQKKVGHGNDRKRRSQRSVGNDIQRLNKFVLGSKLGRMRFADIDRAAVAAFVESLDDLRSRSGEPYAQNTLRDIVRVLSAFFRQAKRDGKIAVNFVRELEPDEKPSSQIAHEQRSLTLQEVERLLAEVGDQFKPLVTTLAWTGLRLREGLGLTWGDLALDGAEPVLHVRLQLGEDGKRTYLKTKNSEAPVPLLPEAITALKAHRRAQRERGIHLVRDEALVFVTETGQPQCARNTLRAIHLAGTKAGLNGEGQRKVGAHSLRHSLSSNLIDKGMPITKVAAILRNDVETLARHYASRADSENVATLAADMKEALGR